MTSPMLTSVDAARGRTFKRRRVRVRCILTLVNNLEYRLICGLLKGMEKRKSENPSKESGAKGALN
jgi:hypothetical protein